MRSIKADHVSGKNRTKCLRDARVVSYFSLEIDSSFFFQTIEVAPFFHNSEAITGVRKFFFRLAVTKKMKLLICAGKVTESMRNLAIRGDYLIPMLFPCSIVTIVLL